ncbi:hypothetical protein FRC18_003888, partial [Serendipita sp. 400]
MPTSASFSSDQALVQRYAAARGHAGATREGDEHGSGVASSVPSSPSSPYSSRTNAQERSKQTPEMFHPGPPSPLIANARENPTWLVEHETNNNAPALRTNATETTRLLDSARPGDYKFIEDDDSAWWRELRTLVMYTLPVFGTHVCEYSLSVVPVVSVGHISTTALAAITLGTMTA